MSDQRFIDQAADYQGTPTHIARLEDSYGEEHVVIKLDLGEGHLFFLDWIGAEYAPEPDECDTEPFQGIKWRKIK